MYNTKKNEVISNLVDVFDVDYKRNITGEYYVLRLRDAYKIYCESNPDGKKVDIEDVPKYLFLKGTPFEARKKYKDEIEYEFANWNDDISTTKGWNTDVSLVRIRKDSFALWLYFAKELGYENFSFGVGIKDSYDYIKPVSQLSEVEKVEILEQYGNNKEVISIMENNNKNVSLNTNDFGEEYYVYDLVHAWNTKRSGVSYKECGFFDVDKDNHDCILMNDDLVDSNGHVPIYLLLRLSDIKDGCYSFSNFNSASGSFVINDKGFEEYSVVMEDITIPLTDALREKYASFEDIPEGANKIIIHGEINVLGNHLKPLSKLNMTEVERLCWAYGNNEEIISIIEQEWFYPLLGVEYENIEEPVMSNGLTKSMDDEIRMACKIAGVKSKILRRRGI